MKKTKIAYLWQDRKRVFGLPLSFTRYRLSEDRLFTSKGFLNVKDDEVLLYRIRDISTSRSLFQKHPTACAQHRSQIGSCHDSVRRNDIFHCIQLFHSFNGHTRCSISPHFCSHFP